MASNLANPQSWNQYAYALNDPLVITDPSGLCNTAAPAGESGLGTAIHAIGNFFCNLFSGGGGDQSSSNQSQPNAGGSGGASGSPFNPINFPGMSITGTFGPFYGAGGAQGANIIANPSNCSSCRWVQQVTSKAPGNNKSDHGGVAFLDDEGLTPFYPLEGGPDNQLNDQPYRYGKVDWSAISVVGDRSADGRTFTPRGAIIWGFTVSQKGLLKTFGPTPASASQTRSVIRQMQQEFPSESIK